MFRLQMHDHALSLSEQASKNIYHKFVQNNLIIRQGILDKKKVKEILFYYFYFNHFYFFSRVYLLNDGCFSLRKDLLFFMSTLKRWN
jgi:hypothetical protein